MNNIFVTIVVLTKCPPLMASTGATWINVEWSICDDFGVDDVNYYTLTFVSLDIEPRQNLTYSPIYCGKEKCSYNHTMAKACVKYGVYVTMTINADTILEYQPIEINTQEQR